MNKKLIITTSLCLLTAVTLPAVSKKQVLKKGKVHLESQGKCSSPLYNVRDVYVDCRGVGKKALAKLERNSRRDKEELKAHISRNMSRLFGKMRRMETQIRKLQRDKKRTKAQSSNNQALQKKNRELNEKLKRMKMELNAIRIKHENAQKETLREKGQNRKNEEHKQQIKALTALVRNLKTNRSIGTQADRNRIVGLINKGKFRKATRELKKLQAGQGKQQKAKQFYLLGNTYLVRRKYHQALAAYQKATLLDPKNPLYWSMSAQTNYLLRQYVTALAESQRAVKLDPVGTAADHERIGKVNFHRNYYMKAAQSYRTAIRLRKQHPKRYQSKITFGRLYNLLGNALLTANRLKQAAREFRNALSIYEPLLPGNHKQLGLVHSNLGTTYNRLYKYNNALVHLKKAADIYRQAWGAQSVSLAHVYNNIGLVYYDTRRFSLAVSHYEKALAIYREKLSPNSDSITIAYVNMGLAYHYNKQYSKAERFLKSAITLYESRNGKYRPFLVRAYRYLGNAYLSQKKYSTARASFDNSLLIAKRFPRIPPLQIARIHNAAGLANNYLNLADRAIKHYSAAISLFKRAGLQKSREYAVFYFNIGIAYIRKRDYRTAHSWFRQSYNLARRSHRPSSPALRAYKKYVDLSRRMMTRGSRGSKRSIDSYNPNRVNNYQYRRQSQYVEELRWNMRESR